MWHRLTYGLIGLAVVFSLGHHLDHAIRGNHVGWPLVPEVTAFTYTLGVYPLIVFGLVFFPPHRVRPGFWAFLSGGGCLFLAAIHFGPAAVEPPRDIIELYEPRIFGWLAFAWLLLFVGVLAVASITDCWLWFRRRGERTIHPRD